MKKRNLFAAAAVSLILATGCGAQPSSQPVSSAEETVSTQVSESADTPSAEASSADTGGGVRKLQRESYFFIVHFKQKSENVM